ncbi:MAG TPA: hypothetical protein EYP68_03925 [Candidatus Korarchaeota archaeon]|nr:hypothetical protein [Candidatus Korarchaeota archaeon]
MGIYDSSLESVPTGIPGFDQITNGGFIRNSIILLAGNPGTGKSTFAAKFVFEGANKYNEPGVYVSFSESKKEFYSYMAQLGMDFERLESKGLFYFVEAFTATEKASIEVVLEEMLEEVQKIRAKRLVVDSITALTNLFTPMEVRALFHNTLYRICKDMGITAIIIADLPVGEMSVGYGVEEFITDALIKLELVETPIGPPKRMMEIIKMRGKPIGFGKYEFVIYERGIDIYVPMGWRYRWKLSKERISTGIRELDELLNGGIRKGSFGLIIGPSGVGKSIIALNFLISGAQSGEASLLLTFQDSFEQIWEFIEEMGYQINELKQYLRIISLQPGVFTSGALIELIKHVFEKYRPERVVIDGINSIRRIYEEEEFIEFARSAKFIAKNNGATLFLVGAANVCPKDLLEHIGAMGGLIEIADLGILLYFDRMKDRWLRKLVVIKAKGSDHLTKELTLEIRGGRVNLHE